MSIQYGSVPSATASPGATRLVLFDQALGLRWAHCNETAQFLGALIGARAGRLGLDAREAEHGVSYLVNEILENIIKFRAVGAGDVSVAATLDGSTFDLRFESVVDAATGDHFQNVLRDLLAGDPGELLIERIEANAEDASSSGSGLGILTLMSDYGVQLGWAFESTEGAPLVTLKTYAVLTLA